MKKAEAEKTFFKKVIDHVDSTWMKKKGIHYPFAGKDFKYLKNYCSKFTEWGVMSLWDTFMESTSEWVQKTGYSLDGFYKCLPWLMDNPTWKMRAAVYEKEFPPPPKEVIELFDTSKFNYPKRRESDRPLYKKAGLSHL